MLVNSVNLLPNNRAIKQKKLNTPNVQTNAQTTFSARLYPSGPYSYWFIKEVGQASKLSPAKIKIAMADHLAKFRAICINDHSRLINEDVAARRIDYKNLLEDIHAHRKSVDIGEQSIDNPDNEFSSLVDYDRRHKIVNNRISKV